MTPGGGSLGGGLVGSRNVSIDELLPYRLRACSRTHQQTSTKFASSPEPFFRNNECTGRQNKGHCLN